MKTTAGKWFLLSIALVMPAVCPRARAGDADPVLKFDFVKNHPLVYAVDSTEKNMTDINGIVQGRTQSSITRTTSESHCKIRLTPEKKNADGSWHVRYEPLDFTVSVDAYSPRGHAITSLCNGLEVKGTQNGIVTIDTTKEIGIQQAQGFKQTLYPQLLSGYLDIAPSGKVVSLGGDLPFVDFWTSQLKMHFGFFDLLLSDQPVAPGGTWDETLSLKNSQGLKFGDEGLVETNTFSRAGKDDGGTTTLFASVSLDQKDVPASMDQLGENTALNISEMSIHKNDTFGFDVNAGKLINSSDTSSFRCTLDALVQGSSMSVTIDVDATRKITLLPEQE
jgi:hypothetical protein